MIVMKFGGTSNQDAAAMRNVIRIVKSHLARKPLVVISAIARATNELEQVARIAAAGREGEANAILDRLIIRHKGIAHDLVASRDRVQALENLLDEAHGSLQRLVQGLSIVRELTPRMTDAICCYGERLSSAIVAAGLAEHDVPSVWVDAKEFMTTNDRFGSATPLMDIVTDRLNTRVAPLVRDGKTPVTQGFIGVTLDGAYTTMGRESSDFSASIIGAAMRAELVQIWTDVDGILTADPTVVKGTRVVQEMSFDEAFELSWFGAKVLHPNTMLPLLEQQIPLEIRNSRNSDAGGTRVLPEKDVSPQPAPLKSITFLKGLTVFTVRPLKRFDRYLVWDGVFSTLSRLGLQADMSVTSEYSLAFAVKGLKDPESLVRELAEFGTVHTQRNAASITLVGEGIRTDPTFVTRVFHALADTPVSMITFGASKLSLTVVLEDERVAAAVNLLHEGFFS